MSLTAAAIRLLAEKGLNGFDIADVAEANVPDRTLNAERQARHRAKRKAAKEAGGVTDDNVTRNVTPPNDNKNSNPPEFIPSEAKASLPRRGKSHRLPDDWQPKPLTGETAAMVAAWPVGMIERELSKFRDYWKSASGRKAAKSDWDAAWRFWLTNADDWTLKNDRKQSPSRGGSTRDAAQLALARMGHG